MKLNNNIEEVIMRKDSSEISYMAKILLLYLQNKQGKELSLATLATAIGTIRQSVVPVLKKLEQDGYILVDKSKRNGNMYFLTDKLNGVKHESRTE